MRQLLQSLALIRQSSSAGDMPLVKARAIVDHVHRDEESPDLRQSAPNGDAGSGSYLGVHMG
jgi:hypothetical protein